MHAKMFADQLRIMAALDASPSTDRALAAFEAVPREDFAGPGPWKVLSPLAGFSLPAKETPDADPKWLYHSILIVLDAAKGINIGDPSLWARNFAQAEIPPGSRILQVGTGVGYYTAILSHLTGPKGHVIAYDVEEALAKKAAANLRGFDNAEVRHGNAATDLAADDRFDAIVAFAGVTHVPDLWTSRLAPEARLLLPLTGTDGWGAMISAQRRDYGLDAVTLGRCGFYPCAGAREDALAGQISELFADPKRATNWRFRIVTTEGSVRFEPAAPA